ncbi:nucleoside phosphorylase [Empedobacter tilapiae]|uniref:Uridine phosphorylase n=1 Tax=Empedobacter tilapiae TaxID=2491114 RepID=A0A4Z1BR03_9FLAO|nr:nucleoside phosphorylase [Empedobacter tilapiae]TGN26312.1 phosphorylase [Empedobacter tilapiae]
MSKAASELVLNADGSIYHCNIKPEHLADTIITVGDPNRVEKVSRHFDSIEHKASKREIVTHTGTLNGKRLTVISTGMGTDNIDIVFSELDALANIDLETGEINKDFRKLSFVRLGTSGALQADIPVDSFVIGSHGLGLDGLLHYYVGSESVMNKEIEDAFINHVDWSSNKSRPYLVKGSDSLLDKLASEKTIQGITATACGFYGPQGRNLRLQPNPADINERLTSFNYNGLRISNFEMETSAIYGLAAMMGHEALSVNAIVANRILGEFSSDSYKAVDAMIEYSLEKLTK